MELLVLEGLMDGLESVETLRDHGDVAPDGLALIPEGDLLAAVETLLAQGLVEGFREVAAPKGVVLRGPVAPTQDAPALHRLWLRNTAEGERAWRQGEDELDAYWAANPTRGRRPG